MRRNDALYADAARIAKLKAQTPSCKQLAVKHRASVQTVRQVMATLTRAERIAMKVAMEMR